MPTCFVLGCKTTSRTKNMSFFRAGKGMLQKWRDALPRRIDKEFAQKHCVCELHFEENCFEKQFIVPMTADATNVFRMDRQRVRLKTGSVPTKNLFNENFFISNCTTPREDHLSPVGTAQTASIPSVSRSSSPEFISTGATISTIVDPPTSMMNPNLAVPDPLALESTSAAVELNPSIHSKAASISNGEITQTGSNLHLSGCISTQPYLEELQFSGIRPLMMNEEEQTHLLNQAYSKCPNLRYLGDFKVSDLEKDSDAHKVWTVCQEIVRIKSQQIKYEREKRRRLDNKIHSLLQVIATFKDNYLISEDIADTLEKGVSQLLSSSDNEADAK